MDPFGTNLSEEKKQQAIDVVRGTLSDLPETTCNHRAECCKAGCPNMSYSEYLSIREAYIDRLDKKERLELLLECIKRYIYKQDPVDPKPCVHLGEDNKCQVYSARPYRCRTYGLIPSPLYKKMVKAVAKETKVSKKDLPLCNQCPHVKIKPEFIDKYPGGKIPKHIIEEKEAALHENDRRLGIPKEILEKGFAYLTYHDWHVMDEMGEQWMADLSQIRLMDDGIEKEQFLEALKDAVTGQV